MPCVSRILFIYVLVADGPDKITVHGPGIHAGILASFEGVFYIDTENAGRGECEVKIKGPKG